MKSGKRETAEGPKLQTQENRMPEEKENHRYLGILEVDTIKHARINILTIYILMVCL